MSQFWEKCTDVRNNKRPCKRTGTDLQALHDDQNNSGKIRECLLTQLF